MGNERDGLDSTYGGHRMHYENDAWFFNDTGEPIIGSNRPCVFCFKVRTKEGHDGCLGSLPNVSNACCGHGDIEEAYVLFDDGTRLEYQAALDFQREHKGG
jgi:hypothetical protein